MKTITLTEPCAAELIAQLTSASGTEPATAQPVAPTGINPQLADTIGKKYPFMVSVNQVVPQGTDGTTYIPETGHVLSVPHEDVGETLIGYFQRTSAQSGIGLEWAQQNLGAVQQLQSGLHNPGNWAKMADELAFLLTPSSAGKPNPFAAPASSGGGQQPAAQAGTGSINPRGLQPADYFYTLFKTHVDGQWPFRAFSGSHADIGYAIDWVANNSEYAAFGQFNPGTYTGVLSTIA